MCYTDLGQVCVSQSCLAKESNAGLKLKMARMSGQECSLCKVRATCFFADLKGGAFEEFKQKRITNIYKKRQVIFYEGHRPHGIFVVCQGRVKTYKTDNKGHQLTTRIANQGDILGYRPLLAAESFAATAEAMIDSCLAYISESTFRDLISRHQVLAFKMLTHLSRDLRVAEDKARDLAMKSSRERLAELLVMLKTTYGSASKNGEVVLKMPYTRLDLAEQTGLAQETVIRLLSELEAQNVIAVKGRTVTILNEKALNRVATVSN